jgi:predicted amino acid dehydrogenase
MNEARVPIVGDTGQLGGVIARNLIASGTEADRPWEARGRNRTAGQP